MEYHASGLAPSRQRPRTPSRPSDPAADGPHIVDTVSVSYYTHLTLRRDRVRRDRASHFRWRSVLTTTTMGRGILICRGWTSVPTRSAGAFPTRWTILITPSCPLLRDLRALCAGLCLALLPNGGEPGRRRGGACLVRGPRPYHHQRDPRLRADARPEGLIRLCTVIIYSVVVGPRREFAWDYAIFMPTLVHDDGLPMTLGESAVRQQLPILICSAINDLMSDFSHVALDSGRGELDERLPERAAALQAGDGSRRRCILAALSDHPEVERRMLGRRHVR